MGFLASIKGFNAQAFSLRNYKRMPLALVIITFILLLPFIVIALFTLGLYYIAYTCYRFSSAGFDFIYDFAHKEATDDKMKHATQFIIYFFAFPILVILKLFSCLFFIFMFIIYFFLNIS